MAHGAGGKIAEYGAAATRLGGMSTATGLSPLAAKMAQIN